MGSLNNTNGTANISSHYEFREDSPMKPNLGGLKELGNCFMHPT